MQVQPYLSFEGRCEEAIEFYKTAVGAEVEMLMRFKDHPEPRPPEMTAPGDKVMHAALRVGDTRLLASDGRCAGHGGFNGFSLTLSLEDDTDAARKFSALGEGGQVIMPLGKTFFASSFGMLTDRFGVTWMVLVPTVQ